MVIISIKHVNETRITSSQALMIGC